MSDMSKARYQRQLLLRPGLLQKELGKLYVHSISLNRELGIDCIQATHKAIHKTKNGKY
jgi:hypothetical protein